MNLGYSEKMKAKILNELNKNKMIKINITLELQDEHKVYWFEQYIKDQHTVLDYRILPDTSDLYERDDTFKRLCKAVKDAQLIKDRYINENR